MNTTKHNGYDVSRLTLGTAQLGLAYGINNAAGMPTFEQSSQLLTTALDLGIKSFDTASAYGESEAVLGKFFAGEKREKTIITKTNHPEETMETVVDAFYRQTERSCKLLGLDKLPFLLLHNEIHITKFGDKLLNALQDAKRQGLVENIGISLSNKDELNACVDFGVFDAIQLSANMFDNKEILSGKLKQAAQSGVCIFVRSLYLQGLFFKDTNQLPESIRSAKAPLDALHALCAETGLNMPQLAFGFMNNFPEISSYVVGADTPDQLKQSVQLAGTVLPEDVVKRILEISETVEENVTKPWLW